MKLFFLKRRWAICAFVCVLLGRFFTAECAETYDIDPVHSSVIFRVKHLGLSYVYGRFNMPSGVVIADTGNISNASVQITVKVENIDTNNAQRDGHLKSPDFFDEKKYPEISFKSSSVKQTGAGSYEITGNMNLHGVSKPLTVIVRHTGSAEDPWGGYRMGFESTFTINRLDFGMASAPGIGDDVEITLSIEAVKKK